MFNKFDGQGTLQSPGLVVQKRRPRKWRRTSLRVSRPSRTHTSLPSLSQTVEGQPKPPQTLRLPHLTRSGPNGLTDWKLC